MAIDFSWKIIWVTCILLTENDIMKNDYNRSTNNLNGMENSSVNGHKPKHFWTMISMMMIDFFDLKM